MLAREAISHKKPILSNAERGKTRNVVAEGGPGAIMAAIQKVRLLQRITRPGKQERNLYDTKPA